ncbi:MAG TPA: hypothetical protein DEP37_02110, partial [Algoriphagus sp.]|nr:hypothetical protein [Algoriphagus sp.]
ETTPGCDGAHSNHQPAKSVVSASFWGRTTKGPTGQSPGTNLGKEAFHALPPSRRANFSLGHCPAAHRVTNITAAQRSEYWSPCDPARSQSGCSICRQSIIAQKLNDRSMRSDNRCLDREDSF